MEKFWMIVEINIDISAEKLSWLNANERKQCLKIKYITDEKEDAERELIRMNHSPSSGMLFILETIGECQKDWRNGKDEKPFIWIEPMPD